MLEGCCNCDRPFMLRFDIHCSPGCGFILSAAASVCVCFYACVCVSVCVSIVPKSTLINDYISNGKVNALQLIAYEIAFCILIFATCMKYSTHSAVSFPICVCVCAGMCIFVSAFVCV